MADQLGYWYVLEYKRKSYPPKFHHFLDIQRDSADWKNFLYTFCINYRVEHTINSFLFGFMHIKSTFSEIIIDRSLTAQRNFHVNINKTLLWHWQLLTFQLPCVTFSRLFKFTHNWKCLDKPLLNRRKIFFEKKIKYSPFLYSKIAGELFGISWNSDWMDNFEQIFTVIR